MSDHSANSLPKRNEIEAVLDAVVREARRYVAEVDECPVRTQRYDDAMSAFNVALPETGIGAAQALHELIEQGRDATVASTGPRCFHYVIGGTTPAALGADWLAAVLDQMAYAWVATPLATDLEVISLTWLRDLFGLPSEWGGVMTTGATMANYVGLAAARQWWGEQHGVDIAEQGFAGLAPVPVLSSGYIHASAIKALSMLGIGRASVRRMSRDKRGRLDADGMESALRELGGKPAIIVGNAGEVNAGEFDPINTLADLAKQYNAWLHVDGAFGLFARVSERTAELAAGVERANSVTVDGHKWLNVPYDCGFAFVSQPILMRRTFAYTADYLADIDDTRPNFGVMGPESSRRARALSVWATLRAYGREGYRAMVEGHLDMAQRLARLVDNAPELERLADVPLNIVCFRYNPGGVGESHLDDINERIGEAILADGRVFAGTTRFEGKVALRPSIVNWRTRKTDIDLFVRVVRELAARIAK